MKTTPTRMFVMLAGALAFGATSVAPASPGSQADAGQKRKNDPNEMVCEKIKETGSRLSVKKVCKTRAEWAEIQRSDRQDIERAQTQRGSCDGCR